MYTGEENEKDSDFCKLCGMDLDKNGECKDCNDAALNALKSLEKKEDEDEIYDRRERR